MCTLLCLNHIMVMSKVKVKVMNIIVNDVDTIFGQTTSTIWWFTQLSTKCKGFEAKFTMVHQQNGLRGRQSNDWGRLISRHYAYSPHAHCGNRCCNIIIGRRQTGTHCFTQNSIVLSSWLMITDQVLDLCRVKDN